MSSVSPSSTSQISNDITREYFLLLVSVIPQLVIALTTRLSQYRKLCLALDTTWKTETYDTFTALSHFLEILESDELKTKYLLRRLSIEEFHAALESQHFPRTYSCEGLVLAVLEASGPPSYLVDYYQTIPSADGSIHSFAIARSCLQPAPYAAFIDSSFKHLVTFQTNRQVFLFKDHRDHLPASFERLPPLPIIYSPVVSVSIPPSSPSYFPKKSENARPTKFVSQHDLLRQPFLALERDERFVLLLRIRRHERNIYAGRVSLDTRRRRLTIEDWLNKSSTSFELNSSLPVSDIKSSLNKLASHNSTVFPLAKQFMIVELAEDVANLPTSDESNTHKIDRTTSAPFSRNATERIVRKAYGNGDNIISAELAPESQQNQNTVANTKIWLIEFKDEDSRLQGESIYSERRQNARFFSSSLFAAGFERKP